MAPKTRGTSSRGIGMKRKRTVRRPAREPSPDSSSTSSSNDSPAPATTPQIDLLASKIVTTGRKVDFELFENEGFYIGRQIIEMGLEKVCSLDCPTYPALIKEFYKNLSRGDSGLISIVKGVGLNVTTSILSRLLDLPLSGPCTFTPEDRSPALKRLLNKNFEAFEEVLANQLPLELRLLHNICGRILFPKTGRFDYVSERDIFVMDAIISGKPFNLPQMMIWYIADCGSKRKSSLPYGMILSQLFRSQGVIISDSEPLKKLRHTDFYNLATIQRMGFIKRNGQWIRKSQSDVRASDLEAPGPSVRHTSPDPPAPTFVPDSTPDPPVTSSIPSSSLVSFSDLQMDQLKSLLCAQKEELLADFERKRIEDLKLIRDDIKSFRDELMSRLDIISLSFSDSAMTFHSELKKIFDHLENVTDGSGKFVNATKQLRKDIELAVTQIASSIEDMKKFQKEDFMEMIGHLKKIVFGCHISPLITRWIWNSLMNKSPPFKEMDLFSV